MRSNPVEYLTIVNPRKSLTAKIGDGFIAAIDFAIENPALVGFGILGAGGISYILYRFINYGTVFGGRGKISFNDFEYTVTADDRLWMGRMLIGETGESGWDSRDPAEQEAKRQAGVAVLYSVAERFASNPSLRSNTGNTFTGVMRAFSQPINPIWSSLSACSNGRGCCGSEGTMCTPAHLSRRQRIQSKSWNALPEGVRSLVDDFIAGRVTNPIPGYNDFAAATHISQSALNSSVVTPINIGGNMFIKRPASQGFQQGTLRIV